MKAMGAPAHIIDAEVKAQSAADEAGHFGLWASHLKPLWALIAARSQFRRTGTFAKIITTGLDYVAADVAWRMAGITLTALEWADLQTLEAVYTRLLNGAKAHELKTGDFA
jgi:hypothetical protein